MRPAWRQVGIERLGLAEGPASWFFRFRDRANLALPLVLAFALGEPAEGEIVGPGDRLGPTAQGLLAFEPGELWLAG